MDMCGIKKRIKDIQITKWLALYMNYDEWIHKKCPLNIHVELSRGIPHMLKPIFWAKFMKMDEKNDPPNSKVYYDELVALPPPDCDNEIRKDITRSLPNCSLFTSDSDNFTRLYDVLKAYSIHNKTVGFCQSLAPVTSFLLTVFKADKAFLGLDILVNEYFKEYFNSESTGLLEDCQEFENLLKIHLPNQWKIIKNANITPIMFCTEWFSCLFVRTLPQDICLTIWDNMLFYGKRFVMQVALAIVRLCFTKINDKKIYDSCFILEKLANFVKENPDKLCKIITFVYLLQISIVIIF